MDSLAIRAKTKPSLLSLLITRKLTVVAEEGVPYQRTIFEEKSPNTCSRRIIFFSVSESKTEGKKYFGISEYLYWVGDFLFVSRTKCVYNYFYLGTHSPFETSSFPCVCHHETL